MTTSMLTSASDALSQVLDAFRLKGSVSALMGVRTPWGYSVPASHDLGLVVITRGRVHFAMEGIDGGALELATGDVIAIPNGEAFSLSDRPGTPLVPVTESGACSGTSIVASGAETEFIIMRCELSGGCTNPVRAALPRLIHCPGNDGRVARWLEPTGRLLALESTAPSTGRTTVLNRLAEIMLVQLIRAWLDGQSPACGGWLRAMTDPQLSGAFAAFHADPGHPWTIESLAARAGMSRSAFAARFKALTDETPLDYMTAWRVQQAKAMIEKGDVPLKQVVASLGYASEAAFRTAFKRRVGQTPGGYRAAIRAAEGPIAH